jgi:hypothetical protein
MLNSGPSGLHKAPVTKCLMLIVIVATLLTALLQLSHTCLLQPILVIRHGQWWRLFLYHLPFTSSGEALLGGILLYCTSMITIIAVLSTVIQMTLLSTLFRNTSITLTKHGKQDIYYAITPSSAPGPYSVIYAALVQYMMDIPVTYRFRIGGWGLSPMISDKTLVYLLAFQLAITRGTASLVSTLAGILAGILYRSNPANIKRWRYPSFLYHFFSRHLHPLLETQHHRPNMRSVLPTPIHQEQLHAIIHLISMGFSREAALQALHRSRNDLQGAINHLLINNHPSQTR